MLTTALKIALRNFQKNRLYTLINISGLAVLAVVIAFLTIGFQSIKAALANPVKSLRSE